MLTLIELRCITNRQLTDMLQNNDELISFVPGRKFSMCLSLHSLMLCLTKVMLSFLDTPNDDIKSKQ